MNRYSVLEVIKDSFFAQKYWKRVWRCPEPKQEYDAVIIDDDGHGLATAYYLAKLHGMSISQSAKNLVRWRQCWSKHDHYSLQLYAGR